MRSESDDISMGEGEDLAAYQNKMKSLYSPDSFHYHEMWKRDVFLIFRRLCKLSYRTITDENSHYTMPEIQRIDIQSRTLAMELIISMFTNSGHIFRSHELFLTLIKQNLCASLCRNGISNHLSLCELSLSIILILMSLYKISLKAEIEIFFRDILLKILEGGGGIFTIDQKCAVLTALSKICDSPQLLVDLFINYDCELGMDNIYENMITDISKIIQSPSPMHSTETAKVDKMSLDLQGKALECLVLTIKSLLIWCDQYRNKRNSKDLQAAETTSSAVPEYNTTTTVPVVFDSKNLLMWSSWHFKSLPTPSDDTVTEVVNTSEHLLLQEETLSMMEMIRNKKLALKQALALFNMNPIKGLQCLKENRLIDDTIDGIVHFLKSTPTLSKTAIGEVLGASGPEYQDLMHRFVDSMDFSKMNLVRALRQLLSTFRLPGESQKIDRIMEKFADRYCDNNPQIFASADTAYTLSFSIIMLNTDLHSPSIKNKMTKAQYLKMNRDISQNNELPDEFLGAIYDDIASNEIVLEEDHRSHNTTTMTTTTTTTTYPQKTTVIGAFNERSHIEDLKQEKMMSDGSHHDVKQQNRAPPSPLFSHQKATGLFKTAIHSDHVKPMFAVSWHGMLMSLSIAFETFDDEKRYVSCLKGFSDAIKISSIFHMETEREALILSLAKSTHLADVVYSFHEKHFEALQYLLRVAIEEGNCINDSWIHIVWCVSMVDQIRHLRWSNYFKETATPTIWSSMSTSFALRPSATMTEHQQASSSTTLMLQPTVFKEIPISGLIISRFSEQKLIVTVDKIFTQSVSLDAKSIIDFIRALCLVSLQEVEAPRPRMFCLQRIVEISCYNMSRIRLEWGSIWNVLRPYFNTVGCNKNADIAGFAVDSLRQLAMKFLERAELAHYHTQNEFLKPFEYILIHNDMTEIRELVIQSLSNIVMSCSNHIRSGWRSILIILTKMAPDKDPHICKISFELLSMIVDHHFTAFHPNIMDLISAVVAYVCSSTSDTADELNQNALQCLQSTTTKILELNPAATAIAAVNNEEKEAQREEPEEKMNNDNVITTTTTTTTTNNLLNLPLSEELFFVSWFPLLSGYSRIIVDSKSISIRARSVDLLFSLLKTYVRIFSVSLWRTILRTILAPIFEDLCHIHSKRPYATSVIWIQALRHYIDLYMSLHRHMLNDIDLLKDVLYTVNLFIVQKNENLAQTGAICLRQLIMKNGLQFRSNDWVEVTTALEKAFHHTTAIELFIPFGHTAAVLSQEELAMTNDDDDNDNVSSSSEKQHHLSTSSTLHIDTDVASKVDFPHAIVKCAIHLIMIQSVKDLSIMEKESFFDWMTHDCQMRWLECLKNSYTFARDFNANYALRLQLWKSGFVQQMPNLIKQETSSAATYISLLFRLYKFQADVSRCWLRHSMFELIFEVTQRYTSMLSESEKYRKELVTWAPIIVIILEEMVQLDWGSDSDLFVKIQQVFQLSLQLMNAEDPQVRTSLQKFLGKIGSLYLKKDDPTINDHSSHLSS
jgi:brefeldin A-inhibited guanine nucleotide-exchange protein